MGYDVNYNQFDYAKADEVCRQVSRDLAEVRERVFCAQRAASRCQNDLVAAAAGACVVARSPSLDFLVWRLRAAMFRAESSASESEQLSSAIGQASRNYESAENRVEHRILSMTFVQKLGDVIQSIKNNNMRPPTEQMETILCMLMLMRPDLTLGWGKSFGDQVEIQTKELTGMIRHFSSHRDTDIVITQQDPPQEVRVDGGPESFYELHSMLEDRGPAENGKFMVVEVDGNTYAVILPGTQPSEGDGVPFDEWGIADALGLESENYVDAIADAIEASGAKEGDEIILSGYSQGGIHVAQLIKNKFLNRKYKMNKMITLGSPIGGIEIPDRVRSLSVEDDKDMVPGTDGTPNKNRGRNHFTTIFDGPRERIKPLLDDDSVFGAPHQLKNYGDHLRELGENPKPEIREHLKHFQLPKTPMKIRKFKIERVPRIMTEKQRLDNEKRLKNMSLPH